MRQQGSQILVAGCAGFVGAQVCAQLLADGHSVFGFDSLNDAYDVRLKHWRLSRLEAHVSFRFARADITDREALGEIFQRASVEGSCAAVIDLAARAGVRYSVENPWVYLDTNVVGTLNLLEQCRQHEIGKFILASSSSLYGNHNPLPYREDQPTDQPLSQYAASKKAAESLCYTYHHLYGLDVTVFRYFTVYGPAGRPDMLPLRLAQWIYEGTPVILYGDGRQSRDFTYVDDIAEGTIAGLAPVGYEVINLGSDRPVSVIEMIQLFEELIGRSAVIVHRPRHPADMDATWADIGKARSLLGWEPRTKLADGVARLVEWYRDEREWARTIVTGVVA